MSAIARMVNVSLGLYLVLATFVWPHDHPAVRIMLLCGMLATLFESAAALYSPARLLNTMLAASMIFATARVATHPWSPDVLQLFVVAGLLVVTSLVPGNADGKIAWHIPLRGHLRG